MRRLLTACCLSLLAATAACGGGGSETKAKPSPPASEAINGTYAASSVRVSSPDKKEKVGPASKEDFDFVFLCADDACSRVYQRSSVPGAFTRLFTVAGDTWTSKGTDKGDCTAPDKGTFTTTEVWTWTRSASGSMEGKRDDTVVGCKKDGTTSFTYTVTGKTAELPYLEGADAAALKKVITDYDNTMKPIYAKYPKCDQDYYDAKRFKAGGVCFSQLFRQWAGALKALGAALDQNPVPSPRGTCQKAIQTITADRTSPLDKITASVAAVPPGLDAAAKNGDFRPPTKKLDAALELQEPFQDAYLGLALQCIAPNDLSGLGTDGVLETDPNKTIKAPATT